MSAGIPAGRLTGVILALVVIASLAIRVGVELVRADDDPPPPEVITGVDPPAGEEAPAPASAPDARPEPVGLKVHVNDRVKVVVEVGGEPWFDGYLCPAEGPRCDGATPLEVPPSPEIAVELSDLSHARLVYNGRRVEPLGNLVTGRRLVFIDDAGR